MKRKNLSKKGTILLIVHKSEKALFIPAIFFQDVIDNIQSMMIHTGYQLEIIYFNSGMDSNLILKPLHREDVVGVLLYATEMPYSDLEIYSDLDKPIVILDSRFPVPNMDMVTLANHISVVNAVEYVYQMGHRRIGFLKSKTRILNFEDRYCGYLDGLRLVGLDFRPEFVFDVASSTDNACSDFLKILETPIEQLPTIFLTDLDYTVVGALLAIKMKGYSVPDDFSLIGFDDLTFMRELDPPITSIQIKPYFGAIAVNRLIEKIEKKTPIISILRSLPN